LLGHGVLLVFGAPCQLPLLAGQEHGRTIPLPEVDGQYLLQRPTQPSPNVVAYLTEVAYTVSG
jgi:hypothetical protein